MAFCPNCGSQAQGAFCPNCGSAVGTSVPPGAVPNQSAYAPPPPVGTAASGLEPHIAAALCYIPLFPVGVIASIIFLVAAPYNQNKFIRFNAFQSLFMHAASAVLGIALGICFSLLFAIFHGFGLIFTPIFPLLWIAVLVLFLYMMYKSFNNQKVKLPFVGDLADKQA